MYRNLSCLLFFLSLLAATAGAQSEPRQSFSDSVDVEIINIEIFATDRQGRPITDLTRDDFKIFENGKAIELTHFTAHQPVRDTTEPADPGIEVPALDMATRASASAETPVDPLSLAIFVDNQNLRPNTRKALLGELRVFLKEHLRPADLVMVASSDPLLRVRQGFTRDRTVLAQALDSVEKDRASGIDEDFDISHILSEMEPSLPC